MTKKTCYFNCAKIHGYTHTQNGLGLQFHKNITKKEKHPFGGLAQLLSEVGCLARREKPISHSDGKTSFPRSRLDKGSLQLPDTNLALAYLAMYQGEPDNTGLGKLTVKF